MYECSCATTIQDHSLELELPSTLQTQTMGIVVDKLIPPRGPVTLRSASGKVHSIIFTNIIIQSQPISLVRLTSPRVESRSASNRTLKRRSSELKMVRNVVSKGSPVEQLQYELKTLTKALFLIVPLVSSPQLLFPLTKCWR